MAQKTDNPVEVFRTFAWHLAGTLASGKSGAARPRPKPTEKR